MQGRPMNRCMWCKAEPGSPCTSLTDKKTLVAGHDGRTYAEANPLTGEIQGTLGDALALADKAIRVVDVDKNGQLVARQVYHGAEGVTDPEALPGQMGLFK